MGEHVSYEQEVADLALYLGAQQEIQAVKATENENTGPTTDRTTPPAPATPEPNEALIAAIGRAMVDQGDTNVFDHEQMGL